MDIGRSEIARLTREQEFRFISKLCTAFTTWDLVVGNLTVISVVRRGEKGVTH